jgi:hypothetical protein
VGVGRLLGWRLWAAVDFIVRSAFGGTGSFVVPVISLWSQTVRADQDVTASRRCGSRWRGRAEQLVWTYPPPSARPKMSAGADTDNGKETAMEPYCSTRRGESRCTAAPLTLTPTPRALYAPDPDSDASVRGEAHHGTGNATKVTGPHDSSASR